MNEKIKELYLESLDASREFCYQRFGELVLDECCLKLLDMDEKTNGNHNYYKHAALQLKQHFRGDSIL